MMTAADVTMKEEVKRNVAQQAAEVTTNVAKDAAEMPRGPKLVRESFQSY